MLVEQKLTTPLNKDDFNASGWESIVQSAPDSACSTISHLLLSAVAGVALPAGERKAAMFELLGRVTSMMLVPENKITPFQPFGRFGDRRSAIPEDFTPTNIDLFADVAAGVAIPSIQARLADIVWLLNKKKGRDYALIAIDAYRTIPLTPDNWHLEGRTSWTRALQLALSIGAGGGTRIQDIEVALVTAFNAATSNDGFSALWFSDLLYDNRLATSSRTAIAARLELIGQERLATGNYFEARPNFEAAEKWYGRASLPDKKVEMVVRVAETWQLEGEAHSSALVAKEFLNSALQCYREVPAAYRTLYKVEEKLAELVAKVAAAGVASVSQMKSITGGSFDISALIASSRSAVEGKAIGPALLGFIRLYKGPDEDSVRNTAAKNLQNSLSHHLFASSVLSADGRTIAKQDAASNGPAAAQAALWAQMIREFMMLVGLVVQGQILPALEVLRLEHTWQESDFEEIVRSSGLIPRDRAAIVAKGLNAGYWGDMVQAIHILVPQVENMVRFHLNQNGAQTTTTSQDGIVMENGMSTLIKHPEMENIFGKDLTFELTAIFCDQIGPNLRNEVAHGLISEEACYSAGAIYAWWLVLRLVGNFFFSELSQHGQNGQPATNSDSGAVGPTETAAPNGTQPPDA